MGAGFLLTSIEPMHYLDAKAKGNHTSFNIACKHFAVERCAIGAAKGEVGYGITDTSTFHRVDWKYRKGRK